MSTNETTREPDTAAPSTQFFPVAGAPTSLVPKIFIDSNEARAEYIALLKQDDLFELVQEKLEIGHIVIEDLVIERKTGNDFIVSLEEGRLFRQLLIMKRLFRKRILLIEGTVPHTSGIAHAGIEGSFTRIAGTMQIPVLHSRSAAHTASLLRRLAVQLFGFSSSHASRTVGKGATQSFYELHVLIGIPNVGLARARALMERFGSLAGVFSAGAKELAEVGGIGDYIARELPQLFRRGGDT